MTSASIAERVFDRPAVLVPQPLSESEFAELVALAARIKQSSASTARVPVSRPLPARWVVWSAAIAAISFLLFHIRDMSFCDPDMWHEMALFRQTLIEGRVPREDRFAYTPTVSPSIHHEWGSGAVFYAVATTFGASGIIVLKFALVAAVVSCCYWCARRRGASAPVFLFVTPAMSVFSSYGFATIRAQGFTLVLLSLMLCLLEADQRGRRWWIVLWLPLHVVWLNIHAGFIVGAGLMALHACEQIVRRRPFWHFVPVGAALAVLILVNPYGAQYIPYLMDGLTMARPLIVEWNPLWRNDAGIFSLYLISLVPIAFVIRQLGFRRLTGIVVLAATAYAAARHTRHLSLYCVVWACYVPGYLQQTAIGPWVEEIFHSGRRLVALLSLSVDLIFSGRTIPAAPWQLTIPSTNADARIGTMCYPVGAVQFLAEAGFRGNLMLPFEVGGYAMWKLFPNAKVSIDGRYEVAYQPGVLEEHLRLFQAELGWQEILTKYPTDAVLIPCLSRLSSVMPTMTGWNRPYCDGVYEVYTRPGLRLPSRTLTPSQMRASMP